MGEFWLAVIVAAPVLGWLATLPGRRGWRLAGLALAALAPLLVLLGDGLLRGCLPPRGERCFYLGFAAVLFAPLLAAWWCLIGAGFAAARAARNPRSP
jgi:MFS family permease